MVDILGPWSTRPTEDTRYVGIVGGPDRFIVAGDIQAVAPSLASEGPTIKTLATADVRCVGTGGDYPGYADHMLMYRFQDSTSFDLDIVDISDSSISATIT
jgi:hypothetical protein